MSPIHRYLVSLAWFAGVTLCQIACAQTHAGIETLQWQVAAHQLEPTIDKAQLRETLLHDFALSDASQVSIGNFFKIDDVALTRNSRHRIYYAWRVAVTGVSVEAPDRASQATLNLTVFLDQNGSTLDAVILTNPDLDSATPTPGAEAVDPFALAIDDGWYVTRPNLNYASTVPEIFTALWKSSGVSPLACPQILLWQASVLPSDLAPSDAAPSQTLDPRGKYWGALIRGVMVTGDDPASTASVARHTGLFVLFDDKAQAVFKRHVLP